ASAAASAAAAYAGAASVAHAGADQVLQVDAPEHDELGGVADCSKGPAADPAVLETPASTEYRPLQSLCCCCVSAVLCRCLASVVHWQCREACAPHSPFHAAFPWERLAEMYGLLEELMSRRQPWQSTAAVSPSCRS